MGLSRLSPSDGVVSVVVLFREYAAFGATAAGGQCRALSAKSREATFPEQSISSLFVLFVFSWNAFHVHSFFGP